MGHSVAIKEISVSGKRLLYSFFEKLKKLEHKLLTKELVYDIISFADALSKLLKKRSCQQSEP
jgi:hypothetical protein